MEVISQIESMIKRVIEGHFDGSQQLSIHLLSRANLNRRNGGDAESHASVPVPRPVSIKFPGNNVQEAWRFSIVPLSNGSRFLRGSYRLTNLLKL